MALRHDDEYPSLTPKQQGEALKIAARLQAEASSTAEFVRAAEEAGIESRFLHEAIRRLTTERATRNVRSERAWPFAAALLIVLIASLVRPLLLIPIFISLLISIPSCTLGRSRKRAFALVFSTWLYMDALFTVLGLIEGAIPTMGWSGFCHVAAILLPVEALATAVGIEIARQACGLQAHLQSRGAQSL